MIIMKIIEFIFVFLVWNNVLMANILISEVMCCPQPATAYKWIELYNNSATNSIDLQDWSIETATTSNFKKRFSLPKIILAPQTYFLIGEENVENADYKVDKITLNIAGSSTNALRIISKDGEYTESVFWNSPNTKELLDDNGEIANSFVPSPESRKNISIARINVNSDFNSALDFDLSEKPTPREANIFLYDLTIEEIKISENKLSTKIVNLSTAVVNETEIALCIWLNDKKIRELSLPNFAKNETKIFEIYLENLPENYCSIKAKIKCLYDKDSLNNLAGISYCKDKHPVVINEMMSSSSQKDLEWLELWNKGGDTIDLAEYKIFDLSEKYISLTGKIYPEDFLIFCSQKEAFLLSYPQINQRKIYQIANFISINNNSEKLIFKDPYNLALDSLSYNISCQKDISFERFSYYNYNFLGFCIDEKGATPLAKNSIYVEEFSSNFKINLSKTIFNPYMGESVKINFIIPQEYTTCKVRIKIYNYSNELIKILENQKKYALQAYVIFDGKSNKEKSLSPGVYKIKFEAYDEANYNLYKKDLAITIIK